MVEEPRWAGLVVVLALAAGGTQAAWLSTGTGRLALVDQWERMALAFGLEVDDARYAQLRALSQQGPLYGAAMAVAAGPVLTVALASGVYLAFRRKAGPKVSYSQALAVVAHASVILALRQIVAAPVGFVRESMASATSLGAWFPGLDAASAVGRFAGAIDVFVLWWVVLLAVGVGILYGRQPRSLAAAFLGVYAGLALLLAVTMTALGGTT